MENWATAEGAPLRKEEQRGLCMQPIEALWLEVRTAFRTGDTGVGGKIAESHTRGPGRAGHLDHGPWQLILTSTQSIQDNPLNSLPYILQSGVRNGAESRRVRIIYGALSGGREQQLKKLWTL